MATTAAGYGVFFITDKAAELIEVLERHEVAGSSTPTLMVAKVASGTAKGSGTDMLASGIALDGTADTNLAGTLHGTAGNRQLAAGDGVALVGLTVRCTFRLL